MLCVLCFLVPNTRSPHDIVRVTQALSVVCACKRVLGCTVKVGHPRSRLFVYFRFMVSLFPAAGAILHWVFCKGNGIKALTYTVRPGTCLCIYSASRYVHWRNLCHPILPVAPVLAVLASTRISDS